MNQCANARAASLERCKRMAQSPLPPSSTLLRSPSFPPSFSSLFPFPLSFLLSNCFLYHIFTITAVFLFHFFLTHLFFSLTLLLDHPSTVMLYFLFISFYVHFSLCSPIVSCLSVPSFLLSPSLLLQFFPCGLPNTLSTLIVFKEGEKKRRKWIEKRKSYRKMKIEERGGKKEYEWGERRVKEGRQREERLKAHYFPPDGRKWVRGQ